jgi:small-conductance mechanosensitive channel
MTLFGVRLVGLNAATGHKILLTLVFVSVILILRWGVRALIHQLIAKHHNPRLAFWARQAVSIASAMLILLSFVSIWFDDPARLATAVGLVTAGLAFALQKVVTSVAGYLVIMRGKTFNVGDRITMGGVRGDVISLGFIQTTIMEMGEPPAVQNAPPAMWVQARQYTGRIVTVTNDKVFEEPIYNYTRDFPYIWEEIKIPIKYNANRDLAESILLEAVARHTEDIHQMSEGDIHKAERKYFLQIDDFVPRVYYHLTDNWLELTVRFIVKEHGIRSIKDCINRTILKRFDEEKIEIASGTYDIVGLPPVRLRLEPEEQAVLADLKKKTA